MDQKIEIKEQGSIVFDWIRTISRTGEVTPIDPQMVKDFIVGIGAKEEISEASFESLKKYSNIKKRNGLDEVWGKEVIDVYKKWLQSEFIPDSEMAIGRDFPTLFDPKTKKFDDRKTNNTNFSGSMQFLGELTAFAYGALTFEKYKQHTERRAKKGIEWEKGREYVPSNNHPFPPGLPTLAVLKLSVWKKII